MKDKVKKMARAEFRTITADMTPEERELYEWELKGILGKGERKRKAKSNGNDA